MLLMRQRRRPRVVQPPSVRPPTSSGWEHSRLVCSWPFQPQTAPSNARQSPSPALRFAETLAATAALLGKTRDTRSWRRPYCGQGPASAVQSYWAAPGYVAPGHVEPDYMALGYMVPGHVAPGHVAQMTARMVPSWLTARHQRQVGSRVLQRAATVQTAFPYEGEAHDALPLARWTPYWTAGRAAASLPTCSRSTSLR